MSYFHIFIFHVCKFHCHISFSYSVFCFEFSNAGLFAFVTVVRCHISVNTCGRIQLLFFCRSLLHSQCTAVVAALLWPQRRKFSCFINLCICEVATPVLYFAPCGDRAHTYADSVCAYIYQCVLKGMHLVRKHKRADSNFATRKGFSLHFSKGNIGPLLLDHQSIVPACGLQHALEGMVTWTLD